VQLLTARLYRPHHSIIATPGRLLHLADESKLNLGLVEYVVFDEADRCVIVHLLLKTRVLQWLTVRASPTRLFEMGLAEQLNDFISRLPTTRQTVLFSATLPKMLVEFAAAGLSNPELIRLDTEAKISQVCVPYPPRTTSLTQTSLMQCTAVCLVIYHQRTWRCSSLLVVQTKSPVLCCI
jgi:superfamily II DNA/RNA helicase